MFSDIRGFTTISEKLDAQELALFLNQYLSDMTSIVFSHSGTLDKYIGDAVMAFWGAPFEEAGHATKACNAALEMMKRVRELQKQWEAEGKPSLEIGIGLNTGVASVGKMGSELRYGYTALGDTVNLVFAARGPEQRLRHAYHRERNDVSSRQGRRLCFSRAGSDARQREIATGHDLSADGAASGFPADGSAETVRLQVELFARARELYRDRQWKAAQRAFQDFLDKWPNDGPSRVYWKRCQEYLFDEPPVGWDGVFIMTHK